MTTIYHRDDSGLITTEQYGGTREQYLAELNAGIPAAYHVTYTETTALLGWPDRAAAWYGNVGFGCE